MKKETLERFKRFMNTRAVWQLFVGMYKQYHFADNPVKIDTYLGMVNPFFVIVLAFDYNRLKNTKFSEKYWINIHHQWLNEIMLLGGIDAEKMELKIETVIEQELNATVRQMQIAFQEEVIKDNETNKEAFVSDEIRQILSSKPVTENIIKRRTKHFLRDNEFRIDLAQMRFTFSPKLSQEIIKRLEHPKVSLIKGANGSYYFRVSKEGAHAINIRGASNLTFNAMVLQEPIAECFNRKEICGSKGNLWGILIDSWFENDTVGLFKIDKVTEIII